ncbi:MAG: Gfo/Idh/MocA family oxidoreductase [Bryobacteraceae bacterium]|nr:Gfo/Idh/MocA family oxidoreductase [Bryobacteraceae bacterium]
MESVDRRAFVGAAAGLLILRPELVRGSQRNSAVRMALYGCGGRGTGVADSFQTYTAAQYVALGDLYQEQTERAQKSLASSASKTNKARVDSSMLFHGPDSLEKLVSRPDIDVVHIATPPYFHPEHLEKAVAGSKHVYLEKPVAVDVAGAKRVMAAGQKAAGKLSLAVGFQLRHATPYVQLVERAHKGALGDIVCGLAHYYASGIPRQDWPGVSPETRRLRNWIYDRVLSGDILVEQNIHLIDVNNWMLKAVPLSAQGTGGRKGRTDHGDCWSHYNVTYTYPNDVHVTVTSTQFIKGAWDVGMRYYGSKGNAEMYYSAPVRITGDEKWEFPIQSQSSGDAATLATGAFRGALDDADQRKEEHYIASITSGKYINEAQQGAESTLSAILGRTAAYTGRPWTWAELLKTNEAWDAKLDIRKV